MKQIFVIIIVLFGIQSAISQTVTEPVPVIAIEDSKPIEERTEVFTLAEQMPEYPEGKELLYAYINNTLKLPKKVKENAISAKVFTKFIVTEKGAITDIYILKGIKDCKECDEEAVRVIKTITKFNPAKMGGKPVKCYYNLPIKFESK
ncbi:MAG: energy transducer TonB [Bacteroidia bacterium]|nr:energy transducer TonB [Bacteroidia bacterium]